MTNTKLFFQLWNPTGMINQVMSLELAVGLAHETKKTTIVHYLSNNGDSLYDFRRVPIYTPSRWYNKQREGFTNPDQFPHLFDLLELDSDIIYIDEKIQKFPQEDIIIDHMMENYYYSNEQSISEDELLFADGRKRLEVDKNIHVKNTLGWYSRFFYNRSKELDYKLNSIRFKDEYVLLARKISSSLGKFQGMHLRLSDHVKMFNTTRDMFENWLSVYEKNNLPIVLSTCDPLNEMVVANKHRVIMLDEFIVNYFSEDFKALSFTDEVVFGLICNLVLQDSINFVGTSGSTYTAYIHRKRNEKSIETWDFFDNPDKAKGSPYSWLDYNLEGGRKMWWREWPESKLNL